jgi:hypothetical protein
MRSAVVAIGVDQRSVGRDNSLGRSRFNVPTSYDSSPIHRQLLES